MKKKIIQTIQNIFFQKVSPKSRDKRGGVTFSHINPEPAITGPGADFAELFQSVDGKPIAPGTSVTLVKGKVQAAKEGDKPIGIIAANPLVLGGNYGEWPGKYVTDDIGNIVWEEYEEDLKIQKTQKVKRERQKLVIKTIEEEVVEQVEKTVKGKTKLVDVKKKVKRKIQEPAFQKKTVGENTFMAPVMETYESEEPVWDEKGEPVMVSSGKKVKRTRAKINSEFDPSRDYVPRSNRPEWNKVGLLGQLALKKGQPTAPTWVKIKSISKQADLWLVK